MIVLSVLVNATIITAIATIIALGIGYIFDIDPSGPGDCMLILAIGLFISAALILGGMWWYGQGNVIGIPLIDEANIRVAEQYRWWLP